MVLLMELVVVEVGMILCEYDVQQQSVSDIDDC
jgi:hypothetical protein